MRTELSPIAQHLILVLAAKSCLTLADLNERLSDADPASIKSELQMLCRADVIRLGVDTERAQIVYWLAPEDADDFDMVVPVKPDDLGSAPAKVTLHNGPNEAEVRRWKYPDGCLRIDVILKRVDQRLAQSIQPGDSAVGAAMRRSYGPIDRVSRPTPAADPTFADVGGIAHASHEFVMACGNADYLKEVTGNRRFFPVSVSASSLLSRAAEHMAERAATYDKPEGERSMGSTVIAFNAITNRDITEAEGWLLLQLLKDVRLFQRPGYHADSAEDCIAYAALKAEAKAREQGAANE